MILSQAWVNCDFLAFLGGGVYSRGSVYFKIRDFRGAFIRGGVYWRRGVYSRKYGKYETRNLQCLDRTGPTQCSFTDSCNLMWRKIPKNVLSCQSPKILAVGPGAIQWQNPSSNRLRSSNLTVILMAFIPTPTNPSFWNCLEGEVLWLFGHMKSKLFSQLNDGNRQREFLYEKEYTFLTKQMHILCL